MSLAKVGQSIVKKIANKKIRIESKIDELKSKFNNGCPTNEELINIINQRNQILKTLTQLKKQILNINKTINPLKTLLTALNIASQALRLAPLPVTVGSPTAPPPYLPAGPVSSLPVGLIVTAGDSLNLINSKILKYKSNISAFGEIIKYILKVIESLLNKLKELDNLIEKCANENTQKLNSQNQTSQSNINNNNLIINNLLNNEDSELINELQSPNENNVNTYKGFILEIIIDDKNNTRFPKRYAVAKTPGGVIVLKGEPSFSSSVDVLLDEIKFIIDRDNLSL